MSSTPMEKRLFRRSFDDGWLDVLVGLGLTGIGVCWLAGAIALTAVVPAVLFPFWKIGREALVEPRLGRVRFSEARTEETRRSLTGWLVLGASVLVAEAAVVFTLGNVASPAMTGVSDVAVAIPVGLIGIGLLAGLLVGARRFIAYSVLAFTVAVAGILGGVEDPAWLILAVGGIVLGSGLVMLFRLLAAE